MPAKRTDGQPRTRDEVVQDEKQIGKNLPDAMIGLDNADVRDVKRSDDADAEPKE